MKFHKIFLSGLLCLSSLPLSAQYNTLNEWYVGPSAGACASIVTLVPKTVDKFYTLGRTAGLTLRYVSEEHFGFQLECNYLEAGWKEDYYGNKVWSDYTYSRQLKFVEVPFLMHMYTKAGAFRFFLNIGPQFSYLLSESEENLSPVVMTQHGKLVEKPFQYGALGGGGLEVRLGKIALGLEGRYSYYTSNLFQDAIGEDFVTSDLQVVKLNAYLLYQL
jgi:hypothetical protein